uniref:uncharacterized protein LOC132694716 n=1 Tax=Panthera onca TaxID=9690 RepID=UPI00295297DA|nr:uncharacterized protein LOC132694716 [Panthera onca]
MASFPCPCGKGVRDRHLSLLSKKPFHLALPVPRPPLTPSPPPPRGKSSPHPRSPARAPPCPSHVSVPPLHPRPSLPCVLVPRPPLLSSLDRGSPPHYGKVPQCLRLSLFLLKLNHRGVFLRIDNATTAEFGDRLTMAPECQAGALV